MKIIAFMCPKGGVGKTMASTSVGYLLGEEIKEKVLFIDGDQQGDASKRFKAYEPNGIGMSELLEEHMVCGGKYHLQDIIKKTPYENIDIVTANGNLMLTNIRISRNEQDNQINRFKMAMKEAEETYDYVVCDCGLLLDMTVLNIIVAADLLIAPVIYGGDEIEALERIREQLTELQEFNIDLKLKVLMTMRQNNKRNDELENWLKVQSGFEVFKTSIRRSVIAGDSTLAVEPLPKFSKRCNATKDYREVTAEIIKDLF